MQTSLSELWNNAVAQANENQKKKAEKAARPRNLAALWRRVSLTMIVHETTCDCCGKTYCIPNGTVLLKSEHPTLGLHYADVSTFTNPADVFKNLPLTTEYRESTVPNCHECWTLESTLLRCRQEATCQTTSSVERESSLPTVAMEHSGTANTLASLLSSSTTAEPQKNSSSLPPTVVPTSSNTPTANS